MFSILEFEGREFQDACLQVIVNHGDPVVEIDSLNAYGFESSIPVNAFVTQTCYIV